MRNPFRDQSTVLFVSLLFFIGFLLVAFFKSSFTTTDIDVNSWSVSIRMSLLTWIAEVISYGFDTTVLLSMSLLMAAYFFYRGYRKNALLLVGAMGGIAAIVTIVKMMVHSARPLNGFMQETGFSFPSGHVTSTVVLFGLLTYFVWQRWKASNAKTLSSVFFVIIEFLVGFSRVYLNVHWLSDVLGGYLLGAFWLTFAVFLFRYSALNS